MGLLGPVTVSKDQVDNSLSPHNGPRAKNSEPRLSEENIAIAPQNGIAKDYFNRSKLPNQTTRHLQLRGIWSHTPHFLPVNDTVSRSTLGMGPEALIRPIRTSQTVISNQIPTSITFRTAPHVRMIKASVPAFKNPGPQQISKREQRYIAARNIDLDWNQSDHDLHIDGAENYEHIVKVYQGYVVDKFTEIKRLYANTHPESTPKEKAKNRKMQLKLFGWASHTLQDLYSHSNYLELARDFYFPGKDITELDPCAIPIFTDVIADPKYADFKKLLEQKLRTGIYPDRKGEAPYRHKDMNKDDPFHKGFYVAYDLAVRETRKAWREIQPHLIPKR